MSFFKRLFGNSEPTKEEKLSTGELNWRLKSEIPSMKKFPNYLSFVKKIEDENNIQLGLHNKVNDKMQKTLVLRQVLYTKEGIPLLNFCLTFMHIDFNSIEGMPSIADDLLPSSEISFMGFASPRSTHAQKRNDLLKN